MIASSALSLNQHALEFDADSEMFELLLGGDEHWDKSVRNIFASARQLAARAVSENSKPSLIVSALLLYPCQILASGSYQAGDWTSDSLHESGTYDWLHHHFGEEIAETLRLKHFAHRFLATVIPRYYGGMNTASQKSFFGEGGLMSDLERIAFCRHRFHQNSIQLVHWIDQGVDRYWDVPDMDFFLPFVSQCLKPA